MVGGLHVPPEECGVAAHGGGLHDPCVAGVGVAGLGLQLDRHGGGVGGVVVSQHPHLGLMAV